MMLECLLLEPCCIQDVLVMLLCWPLYKGLVLVMSAVMLLLVVVLFDE